MVKTIVFIMHTGIIGQGLVREISADDEYKAHLLFDYQEALMELEYLKPDVLVVEVPDHSKYPLSYCLNICRDYKKLKPMSKCILFVTYTFVDNILPEIIEARRNNEIDGFATGNTPIEEVLATIKSLA